ncbi:MAG: ABC transporter-related protein [Candidatus Curtissbacteria bacterium GW2011_GWA1_40_16]|uniref:ABC transporter-related protein n=1 Tax=Candidatus Curtissbacteria bacterium GW2011_GWA1_40_16 TaxID=1618405 RepID=A0A0G0RMQ9_9BACT|nr:MAG: ABC transporter-related protein [Candidatus Curtissbacteria bacterium GW2011_GWA1_40_16]
MKNIWKIIKISKPLHKIAAAIAVLILVTSLLELIPPIISKYIVDEILKQVQQQGGSLNKLIYLIMAGFILSFLGVVLTTASDRLGDHFAGEIRKFLTEKFYDKVLTLPQSYFDSEISGKIVNQLNRAIQTIQNFINGSTNFMLPTFLQSIFTIIVLAYYNVPIALLVAILFPIYLWLSYYSTKRWGEREVEKNKFEDLNRGRITEVISNIKLVKSSNSQLFEFKYIAQNLTTINKIYATQSWTFHKFDFARNLSLILIILGISIVAFYNAFTGSITVGTLVLILQLVNQARRPLFAMSFILTNIQQAESGSKEYFEILALPSRENYKKLPTTAKIKDATIEFKNVSFGYDKSREILKGISFTINKNENVALVGPSGAGKTTIVNLILKFYEPASGEILLKDKNYKRLQPQFVRNNIALVFQESELFSTTIAENVRYSKPNAETREIKDALKRANALDFVQNFPKGIETEVGERGIRLSGGQKQRIQIARAILKNAPILILDEATSSLDAKSERDVQIALENLMKNKLVIVIAHRFSTIQNARKIIVIDNGQIVDYGNPQELATKPGIYHDLLQYQIEGNKKLLEKFEIY